MKLQQLQDKQAELQQLPNNCFIFFSTARQTLVTTTARQTGGVTTTARQTGGVTTTEYLQCKTNNINIKKNLEEHGQ